MATVPNALKLDKDEQCSLHARLVESQQRFAGEWPLVTHGRS